MRRSILVGAAIGAMSLSTPAFAAQAICNNAQLANAIGATGCWYVGGNANSNSNAHRLLQSSAIGALSASNYDYNFGTKWDNSYLDGSDALSLGTTIDFGREMYGETIIALHFGNGVGTPWRADKKSPSNPGGITAFYLFDFDTPTSSLTLKNSTALSNAHLYATQSAVPEPSSWAMLLLGFFGMGGTLRKTSSKRESVLTA